MKIFKKNKERAASAPEKKPEVKSLLLQTYFVSLVCMVLCVGMFLGTSYAWFTSEVNNTGNEIYIGVLKVGLFKQDGKTTKDLSRTDVQLFDRSILWEPGYTTLETIQVVNEGDLAFKYALNFTDGQHLVEDPQQASDKILKEIAACFDIWVYDHQANGGAPETAAYADMVAEGSKWVKVCTLAQALEGKAVLNNKTMPTAEQLAREAEATEAVDEAAVDGEEAAESTLPTHTYTIALHMQETAEITDLMGMKIGLNVKLVAYQQSSEKDSFGSGKYDQLVSDPEELKAALANGGTVALVSDIDLSEEQLTVPAGVAAVLDLNGHKLTATVPGTWEGAFTMIENQGTLTVNGDKNSAIAVTFDGTVNNNVSINAISNRGKLTVNGGTVSNTGTGNQIGYAIDNYNGAVLTVNGGKITVSGSSYYDGIRLFCGSKENVVTVNGGEISSIWAQNPSANKATEVKGTVIVNGGEIKTVYYERYTTVKVAEGLTVKVEPYGNGNTETESKTEDGYTVYTFIIESTTGA